MFPSPIFFHRFVLSSFHGVFFTEARFPPEGRWLSRTFWLPRRGSTSSKYGCGVRFCFLLLSSASSLRFRALPSPTNFTDHLFALHSRRPSFCITKGVALLNTEEGRVNGYQGVCLMDSPTFSSTSCYACFGDLRFYQCAS